jgi:hypothetical protein
LHAARVAAFARQAALERRKLLPHRTRMAPLAAMAESALSTERAFAPEPTPSLSIAPGASAKGPGWVYTFVAIQLICGVALSIPQVQALRVFVRSAAVGTSLLFLVIGPRRERRGGTVRLLALASIAILTLAMFNPLGGTPLSVVAHWTFCLAIIAPLFWVGRLNIPAGTLAKTLLLVWAFHTVGALLGVLQAYFPAQFQPNFATLMLRKNLLIRLASGELIPRPTGLTDVPGGGAADGMYAALLGTAVVLVRPFRYSRLVGVGSIILGLMCISLCEVRAAVVMVLVCFTVMTALFAWSGHATRATVAALLLLSLLSLAFYFALGVGGQMMSQRLQSLIAADPGTVYYNTRGAMLEEAFVELLPMYPLGAGLGHWGMMNSYFGSSAQEIGSEIQIGGWVLDGGAPLLLTYVAAVVTAILYACRASRVRDTRQATWAAAVASYSVGGLALCFSYPYFMGSAGLEFWLVNALLMQEIRLPRIRTR